MKHLLISSVSRTTNRSVLCRAQVFDVGQNDISRLTVELVVLATKLRCDVCRNTSINDQIVLASMLINAKTTDYKEAMAVMELIRKASQLCMQCRKWKRVGRNVTDR